MIQGNSEESWTVAKKPLDKIHSEFRTVSGNQKRQEDLSIFPPLFALFQNVFQTRLQYGQNMIIRKGVQYILTVPTVFNQVHLL